MVVETSAGGTTGGTGGVRSTETRMGGPQTTTTTTQTMGSNTGTREGVPEVLYSIVCRCPLPRCCSTGA